MSTTAIRVVLGDVEAEVVAEALDLYLRTRPPEADRRFEYRYRAARAVMGRVPGVYGRFRRDIGRSILLGLELLIIADIILTVTVDQTLESAATLGIIVLVRTFLSFSLEVELEGVLPWRKREARRAEGAEEVVDLD